jgi:Zn finger protein HypA/HybF involved in hydrogenase expression
VRFPFQQDGQEPVLLSCPRCNAHDQKVTGLHLYDIKAEDDYEVYPSADFSPSVCKTSGNWMSEHQAVGISVECPACERLHVFQLRPGKKHGIYAYVFKDLNDD